MQFDLTQDFPVGLDRLWTALGRTEYIEAKYRTLGSTSLRIRRFCADARVIEIDLEREAPVAGDELPLWARLVAGKRQAMRHHTRWSRAGSDRVAVELDVATVGLPLRARGTGAVRALSPALARLTLHFEVESPAALGARVAQVFARQVKHAIQSDHAFTLDYLERTAGQP